MRTLTVFLAGSVACGAAPCPAAEESSPLLLGDLRTVEESDDNPCDLASAEGIDERATVLVAALAKKDSAALQPLVHPERGLALQWSRPIAWAKLPRLFEDEGVLRGWCAAGREPFEATPNELLQAILERTEGAKAGSERDADALVQAVGRWRYGGVHSGVCLRRGDLWRFSDEAFVELDGGLVVVFARSGSQWLVSALVRLDLGSPCG